MGGVNDFINSKISISKYTAKIKTHRHKKLEPVGISIYAFSTAQEVCSELQTRQNAHRQFSYTSLIASKDYYPWPSG